MSYLANQDEAVFGFGKPEYRQMVGSLATDHSIKFSAVRDRLHVSDF